MWLSWQPAGRPTIPVPAAAEPASGALLQRRRRLRVEPGVSDPVQVTRETCVFYYDYAASGGIMAFEYSANGLLATIREDGTGLIPITDPNIQGLQHPSLSPDGSMVAYFAQATNEDFNTYAYDIFVSPTDGSSPPVNIAHASGIDFFPVWSPDGTRIAYINSPDLVFGQGSLYVVDVDGSHRTNLTPNPGARHRPRLLSQTLSRVVTELEDT